MTILPGCTFAFLRQILRIFCAFCDHHISDGGLPCKLRRHSWSKVSLTCARCLWQGTGVSSFELTRNRNKKWKRKRPPKRTLTVIEIIISLRWTESHFIGRWPPLKRIKNGRLFLKSSRKTKNDMPSGGQGSFNRPGARYLYLPDCACPYAGLDGKAVWNAKSASDHQ